MTQKLVICRFSEQRYMILNLCTFLWDTRYLSEISGGEPDW